MADKDYYIADEKKIIHPDGWMFFVRDADEGLIEIGYRECRDGKYQQIGGTIEIAIDYAQPLAEALMHFANRKTN